MRLEALVDLLSSKGCKVRRSGSGYMAQCPAHDDRQASLSITEGTKQPVVLKCHAGCTLDQICAAINIDKKELCAAKSYEKKITRYIYTDELGNAAYRVNRSDHYDKYTGERIQKIIRPSYPDGNTWKYGLPLKRYPYQLTNVLTAQTVYIVEGEKAADEASKRYGVVASCNVGGSKAWRPEHGYGEWFKDKDVVILPDNDAPGRAWATDVLLDVRKCGARSVKIVDLPGLPDKGDIVDWDGTNLEELVAAAPEADSPLDIYVDGFYFEDAGIASAVVRYYGDEVVHVEGDNSWVFWWGGSWLECSRVNSLLPELLSKLFSEKKKELVEARGAVRPGGNVFWRCGDGKCIGYDEAITGLEKHHKRCMGYGRFNSIGSQLSARRDIVRGAEYFGSVKNVLGVSNGVVDLTTGKLRETRKEDLIRTHVPIVYEPSQSSELWDRTLLEIMEGDEEMVAFLARIIGHAICGDTEEQKIFYFLGSGANGKSLFCSTIQESLRGLWGTLSANFFDASKDVHVEGITRCAGKKLAFSAETALGASLNEPLLKQISGNDVIPLRRMHAGSFDVRPQFKLIIQTNHMHNVEGLDHAIWRRLCVVPFNRTFTEPDGTLFARMREEVDGVLTWCVKGAKDFIEGGLRIPEKCEEVVRETREECNMYERFFNDQVVEGDGLVSQPEISKRFIDWAKSSGEEVSFSGKREKTLLRKYIEQRGYKLVRHAVQKVFRGIRLREAGDTGGTVHSLFERPF